MLLNSTDINFNPANTIKITPYTDSFDTSSIDTSNEGEGHFEESLTRTYIPTGFLQGYNEIKGKVNGKTVELKETEVIDNSGKSLKYEGKIDNKKTEIIIKDKTIKGKFDKKEFELQFDKNSYNEFFLNGSIGNEMIDISDGSNTSEIADNEDIIVTVLSLLGHKLNIKDNKIQSVGLSKQAKADKSAQNFSDWQIAQQNQIMAQSIEIRNKIAHLFEENSDTKDDIKDDETIEDSTPNEDTDDTGDVGIDFLDIYK